MKKNLILLAAVLFSSLFIVQAQKTIILESQLVTLDGTTTSSSEIFRGEQPIILIFWKTYEKECCNHITSMVDAHSDLPETVDARLVCICIDCNGQTHHVKPFVNGKNWDFEVYIDKNGDFKRAMGVSDTPFTMLYYNEKIVCQYNGYCSGTEEMICNKLQHCLAINE